VDHFAAAATEGSNTSECSGGPDPWRGGLQKRDLAIICTRYRVLFRYGSSIV